LIKSISKMLGFKYEIKLVEDGKYGSFDKKKGKWNGMIGELQAQKADLVVADITITVEREKAVDFTMPFMDLGVTILYKKPAEKDPDLFAFLSPFTFDLWGGIILAYLAMSMLLFTTSRMSTHKKVTSQNMQVHLNSGEEEIDQTSGSLCQRGDKLPRAFSAYMIAVLWCLFTLFIVSLYTANMAALLSLQWKEFESSIESVEDLASQQKVKYGAVKGGSTAAFFRDSEWDIYARMWYFMEQNNVFVRSTQEGIDRVIKEDGNYAFLTESTVADYVVERKCQLTKVGGLLDKRGYGIALPLNSMYRKPISNAILKLQQKGILHQLKEKWWKQMRGGGVCKETYVMGPSALTFGNISGIFILLLAGLGIVCLIAGAEYFWNKRQDRKARKITEGKE